MNFSAFALVLMMAVAFAAETTATVKTPAAPAQIALTVADGLSDKDGYCKVYATAPADAVIGKTEIKLGATTFIGFYRKKVFARTRFAEVAGKLLGELQKAKKAHITMEITYMKKVYHCHIEYAPNNNCSYSKVYQCKSGSFLMASLKFLALVFVSAFFF